MKKNLLIIILLLFTSTWSIGQEAPDKSGPKEIVKTLKASNLSDLQIRQFVKSPPTGETFYEGFEGEVFPPAGWKVINDGSSDQTWVRYTEEPITGNASASIRYSSQAHDDWLITPPLAPVDGNNVISFRAKQRTGNYIDKFNVKLSTTGNNKEDFTVTLASNLGPESSTPETFTYDLSAYNGQTVYFAIQAISTNQERLYIDDFIMTAAAVTEFPYKESFDGEEFPPSGWSNLGEYRWERVTGGGGPACNPFGTGMLKYNCWDYASGSQGTLVSRRLDMGSGSYGVGFKMYRDKYSSYSSKYDKVEVFVNTLPDTTGATKLGTIYRYTDYEPIVSAEGWYDYAFIIPAAFVENPSHIILLATSDWGTNIYVDEFVVDQVAVTIVTLVANPSEGGSVEGGGAHIEGTEVNLTATANTGYKFKNWTNASNEVVSTNETYNYLVGSSDVTFTANFEKLPTVTFTVSDTENNPIEGATVTVKQGETLIETVVTNSLGKAVIYIANGDYTYSVTALGYFPKNNVSFTIDGDTPVGVQMLVAPPTLEITPDTFVFAATQFATSSAPQAFTMENTGGGTLTINPSDITITGTDADQFTLTTIESTVNLGAAETASFTVRFTPTTVGEKTATIKVDDNLGTIHEIIVSGSAFDFIITEFPYKESFDSEEFPPPGWLSLGEKPWERVTSGSNPTCDPFGAGMLKYNCWDYTSGRQGTLVSRRLDMGSGSYGVGFKMYRDKYSSYSSKYDKVEVFVNTLPDTTGATKLGTIYRYTDYEPIVSAEGWYDYAFIIPAAFVENPSHIILLATSDWGTNIYVDEFVVDQVAVTIVTLVANPSEGGSVEGGGAHIEGTEVNLTATANTGYKFKNWTNASNEVVSTNETYNYLVGSSDVTFTANFEKLPTVTFTVSDTENNPIEGATVTVKQGETLIETVVTNSLGKAVIYIANGDYTYSVTALGYFPKNNVSFTIDGDTPVGVQMLVAPPTLEITPDTFVFAATQFATSSAPQAFTMENTGGGTLTINPSDITITGTDADQFTLTTIESKVNLGAAEIASFTVRFTPTTVGEKTATIKVNDNLGTIHEIIVSGYAADFVIKETFEGEEFPPAGWKIINDGSPTRTWERYTDSPIRGNSSAIILYSSSAHDDWLITPPLKPEAGYNTITFKAKQRNSDFIEKFNVKLSTTGNNKEDFTVTLASNVGPASTTVETFVYDLSAYNGQTVYIAIQAISTDQFGLIVDDFVMAPTDLVVTGDNKDYRLIPEAQLESSVVVKTNVENQGAKLNEDVNVTVILKDAGNATLLSSTGVLDAGFATGQMKTFAATSFDATTLSVGDYSYTHTADYTADYDSTDNTDIHHFSVTEYIYARDAGVFPEYGIGSGYGAYTFGNLFTIVNTATIAGVQFVWPDTLPDYVATYQLALYRLDDAENMNVTQTIFTTDTYERIKSQAGKTMNIGVSPEVLQPGIYVLAVKQTSYGSIRMAYDKKDYGYFLEANYPDNPTKFKIVEKYGNLSLRMDFSPRSIVSFNITDGTNPVEGITVAIKQGETVVAVATSDASGLAKAYVFDGNYTYTAEALGYKPYNVESLVVSGDTTITMQMEEMSPALEIIPDTFVFAATQFGRSSDPQTFIIRNIGGGTLTINPSDITITGADADQFTLTTMEDTVNLGVEDIAGFVVTFTPTTVGEKTATIKVNDNLGTTHEIIVSGSAVDFIITEFPYKESFDSEEFPPPGWSNLGECPWERVTGGGDPTCSPFGAGMLKYNCWDYTPGRQGTLVSRRLDMGSGSYGVGFKMYRDKYSSYSSKYDKVEVFVNTLPDTTGATKLGTIYRYTDYEPIVSAEGWYDYAFIIPAAFVENPSHIILLATSDWGTNIYVDEFVVDQVAVTIVTLVANPSEGGSVEGGGSHIEGTTASLTATSNAEYKFVNWTNAANEVVSTAETYNYIVGSSDVTFTANFEALPKYTVTFTVVEEDAANPVEGASIVINADTLTTDASGTATIALVDGSYLYTISKEGFVDLTESADVSGADLSINKTLIYEKFSLTLAANPAEGGGVNSVVEGYYRLGADVTVEATPAANYKFVSWTKDGLVVSTNASFVYTMPGEDLTLTANFAPESSYILTFTIADAESNAIGGALVAINEETLITNASGVAIIALENETYPYTVSKYGYVDVTGSAVISGADAGESVTMQVQICAPFALTAKVNNNRAKLSWNPSFTDDMESYEDFIIEDIGDYTLVDVDGSATYDNGEFDLPNEMYTGSFMVFNPSETTPPATDVSMANWFPRSGSKYLACFAALPPSQGGTGPNNDWLITPGVRVVPGMKFSFWARSVHGSFLESFRVGISTTDTDVSSFTFLTGSDSVKAPAAWTQYKYDLGAYEEQQIYLAINCVSDDVWAFLVDDIYIGGHQVGDPATLTGFNIYLGDEKVASGVTETGYTITGLPAGTHNVGVQSVYGSEVSEIVTTSITVHQTYTVTFTVVDTEDNPIANASIAIDEETLTTDASGVATIDLVNGDYTYTVSRPGYADLAGSFTVDNAAQTIHLNMTGMDQLTASSVRLYPNPVKNTLIIEHDTGDELVIELYNITGTLIGTTKTGHRTTTIDVGALSSGSYFVRITGNGKTPTVHRFIKQ